MVMQSTIELLFTNSGISAEAGESFTQVSQSKVNCRCSHLICMSPFTKPS